MTGERNESQFDSRDGDASPPMFNERVVLWTRTVEATPGGMAEGLRTLADIIESANGDLVFIQLASTGFGEPWQWTLQATLTTEVGI